MYLCICWNIQDRKACINNYILKALKKNIKEKIIIIKQGKYKEKNAKEPLIQANHNNNNSNIIIVMIIIII